MGIFRRVRATIATALLCVAQAPTGIAGFWLRRQWGTATTVASALVLLWMVFYAARFAFRAWLFAHPDLLELPDSLILLAAGYLLIVLFVLGWALLLLIRKRSFSLNTWSGHPITAVVLGLAAIVITWRQVSMDFRLTRFYLQQGGIELAGPAGSLALQASSYDFRRGFYVRPYCSDSWIVGRLACQGHPVKAAVKLFFGRYYRSAAVWTDKKGVFRVPAPTGNWPLVKIEVFRWRPPVDGEFTLIWRDSNGHSPPVDTTFFNTVDYEKPLIVEASEQTTSPAFTAEIRRGIKMIWPLTGRLRQTAKIQNNVIAWEPVVGASKYRVSISHLVREDRTEAKPGEIASGSLVLERTTSAPTLPLATLPWKASTSSNAEYYVDISAYDDAGGLLSFSASAFATTSFVVEGNTALVRELETTGNCR